MEAFNVAQCQLCLLPMKAGPKVGLRSRICAYDQVCRACVRSALNKAELLAMERARQDFERARSLYQNAPHTKGNFISQYDELYTVVIYDDLVDFSFRD